MPEWIDISRPLHSQMAVPPGFPITEIINYPLPNSQELITRVHINANAGTHLITPETWDNDTQQILSQINGSCRVISIKSSAPHITVEHLAAYHIVPGSRVLLKTKNSHLLNSENYQTNFVTLSSSAAQYLADRRLNLLGFDYYHLDPYGNDRSLSQLISSSGIPLLAGINLDPVAPGDYEVLCLPLALPHLSTRPARAVLKKS